MNGDCITMAHGEGGRMTSELISGLFARYFHNPELEPLDDAAVLPKPEGRLAFTTDGYVIRPIFFPGGDIGKLAVCGTVNDLAVMGADPMYLTCGAIIAEGFAMDALERITASMAVAASEAGVRIVAGDTKVVEKGAADGIFLNTAGVGVITDNVILGTQLIEESDLVIVNGPLGDHSLAVLSARNELGIQSDIKSDCAPLNGMIRELLESCREVHFMRDLTRGGLGGVLNEVAKSIDRTIIIEEKALPVRPEVRAACEILGISSLFMANEGKIGIFCSPDSESRVMDVLEKSPYGQGAAVVGRVATKASAPVLIETLLGGCRVVETPAGAQLPRIC
ncbi:hydrogenase expression/formation protein HypE [Candidatus Hydrogenedentota bacterium]